MRLFKSQRHKYRNDANTKAHLEAWGDGMGGYSDRSSPESEYASVSEREPGSGWRNGAYTGDFTAGSIRCDDDSLETEIRYTMECMDDFEREKDPTSELFVPRSRKGDSRRSRRRSGTETITEDDRRKELYRVYRSQRKERKQTVEKRTRLEVQAMSTALQDIKLAKTRLRINHLTQNSDLDPTEVTDANTVSYMLNKLSLMLTDNINRYDADCRATASPSMSTRSRYSSCGKTFGKIGRQLCRTFQTRSTRLIQGSVHTLDFNTQSPNARAQAVWPPPKLAENSIWGPTADARRHNNLLFCNSIRLASHSSIDTDTSKTQSCLLNGLSALTNVSRSPSQKTAGRRFLDNLIADFADRHAECTDRLDREEWEVERERSALLESKGLSTNRAGRDNVSSMSKSQHVNDSLGHDIDPVGMNEIRARSERKVKGTEAEMSEWEMCYHAGLRAREALSTDI